MKKLKWFHVLSLVLILTCMTGLFSVTASAGCAYGIQGNGTGGISININAAPYTTYQSKPYGSAAYGTQGCAWFASARACQLTGKDSPIWSGTNWYHQYYNSYGAAGRGSAVKAKALACWEGHVAVVEAVSGSTAVISEGGSTYYSDAGHGYCVIRSVPTSYFSNDYQNGKGTWLGFVYLNAPGTPVSYTVTPSVSGVTDTNAVIRGTVNGAGVHITGAGCTLWDSSGNRLGGKTESVNFTQDNPYAFYDINAELGVTLKPGTTYTYQVWLTVNGVNTYSGKATFKTTGSSGIPVDSISFSGGMIGTSYYVSVGETINFNQYISFSPANATDKTLTWSIDNPSAATVSNGSVTGAAPGIARLTARTSNGRTAVCTILVEAGGTFNGDQPLKWQITCNGLLQISPADPSQKRVPMQDFTEEHAPWYPLRSCIRSADIASGVSSVGVFAISGCPNLTRVTLPDTMEIINDHAFSGCPNLKEIVLPESVYRIEYSSFLSGGLENIYIYNPDCFIGRIVPDGSDITIYGYDGSTAESCAAEHDYRFVSLGQEPNQTPFSDIFLDDWYYSSVKFVCKQGIMTGTNGTTFSPYQPLNRAMFALILYRLEDEPQVNGTSPFPDVSSAEWYSDAVIWANQKKIVTGFQDTGLFCPADSITREQLAVMLFRYTENCLYGAYGRADLSSYQDCGSVSEYAREAMEWAVADGIISGKYGQTQLDPHGTATRAECAVMLERYCRKYHLYVNQNIYP